MVPSERLTCGCPRVGNTTRRAGAYVVNRCTYLPSCNLGTHAHAEDRIVLALHGALRSIYGTREFRVDASQAIYRPASVDHCDGYARQTVCLSIRLPAGERRRLGAFVFRDPDLESTAVRLCAELGATDSAAELAIESLSAQIAARLRPSGESEPTGPRWIRRVLEWIEEEYAEPPTLRAIARGVDRDVSHVANVFRKTYGKSIGGHIRDIRVWRTRKLVEDPEISLAEAAQRGGFADQSHFARLFKRHFAMTPGEYRRRAVSRKSTRS